MGGILVEMNPVWEETRLGGNSRLGGIIWHGSTVWEESQWNRFRTFQICLGIAHQFGGILVEMNPGWEESRLGGIPVGRNPGVDESRLGGIPVWRNPSWGESQLGGNSRLGGIIWPGRVLYGRNPKGTDSGLPIYV